MLASQPGICETTPGVKSYSGYIHLPPGTTGDLGQEQDFAINTFFWFFEARKDPENAPLSIWLNGGPGASSMPGLLYENGPCYINDDSNSTRLSEWSWNNEGMFPTRSLVQAEVGDPRSFECMENLFRRYKGEREAQADLSPFLEKSTCCTSTSPFKWASRTTSSAT